MQPTEFSILGALAFQDSPLRMWTWEVGHVFIALHISSKKDSVLQRPYILNIPHIIQAYWNGAFLLLLQCKCQDAKTRHRRWKTVGIINAACENLAFDSGNCNRNKLTYNLPFKKLLGSSNQERSRSWPVLTLINIPHITTHSQLVLCQIWFLS